MRAFHYRGSRELLVLPLTLSGRVPIHYTLLYSAWCNQVHEKVCNVKGTFPRGLIAAQCAGISFDLIEHTLQISCTDTQIEGTPIIKVQSNEHGISVHSREQSLPFLNVNLIHAGVQTCQAIMRQSINYRNAFHISNAPGHWFSQLQLTLLHLATLVPNSKAQFEALQDNGLSAEFASAKFTYHTFKGALLTDGWASMNVFSPISISHHPLHKPNKSTNNAHSPSRPAYIAKGLI